MEETRVRERKTMLIFEHSSFVLHMIRRGFGKT
jgi:hypothetical protein